MLPAYARRRAGRHGDAVSAPRMSWPALAEPETRPEVGDIVGRYDLFTFRWTGRHRTSAVLAPLRQLGDSAADDALEEILADPGSAALGFLPALRASAEQRREGACARLLAEARDTPSWVDWRLVEHGQTVLVKYLPVASVALYYASLVAGMSVPAISKVVSATRYLTHERKLRVSRRLLDTYSMVMECLEGGAAALLPGGAGWEAVLGVRLLHTLVRRRLRSDGWDEARDGVPINQEDMSVTTLAFSFNVLATIEAFGGRLTETDRQGVLALWAYIGWLIGNHPNPCQGTFEEAAVHLESHLMHLLQPDKASAGVARGLLSLPPSGSFGYRCAMFRAIVGNDFADALQLPVPSGAARLIAQCQLWYFRVYTMTASWPLLGPMQRRFHQSVVRRVVFLAGSNNIRQRRVSTAAVCPVLAGHPDSAAPVASATSGSLLVKVLVTGFVFAVVSRLVVALSRA